MMYFSSLPGHSSSRIMGENPAFDIATRCMTACPAGGIVYAKMSIAVCLRIVIPDRDFRSGHPVLQFADC